MVFVSRETKEKKRDDTGRGCCAPPIRMQKAKRGKTKKSLLRKTLSDGSGGGN